MYKVDVTLGLYLHDINLNVHQQHICVLDFTLFKELCLICLISFIMQELDNGDSEAI